MPNELVIDCSVAAKWILPEPDRELAMQYLDQWQSGTIILLAPDILLAEIASLLAKKHRRKELTAQQAIDAYGFITAFAPKLEPSPNLMPLALNLSLQHQVSLWDATYLALAIQKNCPLVTADIRLFRGGKARHQAISLLTSL
jgi:predicted nucleic acid-binding protein